MNAYLEKAMEQDLSHTFQTAILCRAPSEMYLPEERLLVQNSDMLFF